MLDMHLALLPFIPVLHKRIYWFLTADGRIARKGGSGSEHLVSCLELADLVQRKVHIRTELFFSAV